MIRIAWHTIRNNMKTSFLFIIALVLVLTFCPIMFINLERSEAKVSEEIEKYGRGTYDILVRPKNAQNIVEKQLNLVQDNFSHYENGGLTLSDWENIKVMDGIEVAAPIASIGYFTGVNKSFSLPFPKSSSKYTVNYFTSDSMNEYKLEESQTLFYVNGAEGNAEYFADSIDVFNSNNSLVPPSFLLPTTYHFLVAIDPISESELTGTSFKPLLQASFPDKNIPGVTEKTANINVMKSETVMTSLTAVITRQLLDNQKINSIKQNNSANSLTELFDFPVDNELFNELNETVTGNEELIRVDFSNNITPFEFNPFSINNKGEISDESIGFLSTRNESTRYFLLSNIDYIISEDNKLHITQVGIENGVPIYRDIYQKGASIHEIVGEIPFLLNIVGSFHLEENKEALAASPLGIYSPNTAVVEGKDLQPTIYPGSFIPAPAQGIIDIKYAPLLKNDHPINAIRVRVKDIEGYNEKARMKIEDIALQLIEMGFHVDVVAGASPEQVTLDVENIGEVKETWTSLGAAVNIMTSWDKTSMLLTICFILVAIFFIINRSYFKIVNAKDFIELLQTLNWGNKQIKKVIHYEYILLQLISGFVSLMILVLFYSFIKDERVFLIQIFLFIFMYAISTLLINLNIRNKDLKNGKVYPIKNISLKNIIYFKRLLIPSFIQVTILAFLLMYMVIQIFISFEKTSVTLLGEHINKSTLGMQLSIICAMIIITVFTIIDYISNLFIIRKEEFQTLLIIGWKVQHIRNSILKETILWSLTSVTFGYFFVMILLFNNIGMIVNFVYLLPITIICSVLLIIFLLTFFLLNNMFKSIN